MASLFGGGSTAKKDPPATSLRIQQSIQGAPIPIGWGRNRMAGNLIDYDDFQSMAQQQQPQGGKGAGSSGGKFGSGGQSNTVNYQAAVAIALAQGGDNGLSVDTLYANSAVGLMSDYNLTLIPGTRDQLPWGYMTTFHPDKALSYRGLGYMAAGPMQLGPSPVLPNISVEVTFSTNTAIAGVPDANAADIITEFLTDDDYGLTGFDAELLADLSEFETFCQAAGIFLSPILTTQSSASSFLQDVLYATNSEAFFSGGQLSIVPYWDRPISGNGATFTPALAPVYDFAEDDFIAQGGGDPIKISRKPTSKIFNCISLQIADRTNYYNPTVLEVKNEASIQQFGLKKQTTKQLPMICLASSGMMAAQMQLARQDIMNDYTFTVPGKYIKVNPMDVVTLTSSKATRGLTRYPVRVKEITENKEDGSLTMFAEDLRPGANSIVRASHPAPDGAAPDYNVSPGSVVPPVIFEPPHGLAGDLEVWGAVYGADPNWGGCEIWVSSDGLSYEYAGRQLGPARVGVLSAALAPPVVIPPQPDVVNTLSVDISASGATLSTASEIAAQALGTVCWIEGEVLAYANATPVGVGLYDLTYLIRGAYGTQAALVTHPAGSRFVRLDEGVFRIPYTRASVGITLFVKFLSFNRYGSARQTLADAAAYMFTNNGTSISLQPETLAERIDRLDKAVTEQIQPTLDLFAFVTADLDASGLLQRYQISGDIRSQVADAANEASDQLAAAVAATNDQIIAVVNDQNAQRATLASAIQVQIDSANAAITTNATTIASVNGALSTLSTSVTTQFATTNANVSTLSTSFSDAQTALASYQLTVAAHFTSNEALITSNATAISTATGSIASLSTTVSANYSTLSGNIATNTGNIAANTANITTNAIAIADANTSIGILTTTVSANYLTLAGGIATNSANITTNTTAIADANQAIGDLTTVVTANYGSLSGLISTNSATITSHTTAIADANHAIGDISTTVTANYGTLSGQISVNSATITSHTIAISTATTNLANLTSTVTSNYDTLSSSVGINSLAISDTNNTLSSLTGTVSSNYGTLSASVTANATAIATTSGQVASMFVLTLNANNYIAGFTSVNTGSFSAITFQFDAFRIASSTVGGRSVFDLVTVNGVTTLGLRGDAIFDGAIQARMVGAQVINAGHMDVDSIDGGSAAFKNLSVLAFKIGDNAITVPDAASLGFFLGTGSGATIFNRNIGINTVGLNGKQLALTAICVAALNFTGVNVAWDAVMYIDGVQVQDQSGLNGTNFVLAGAATFTGNGSTNQVINVTVNWNCSNSGNIVSAVCNSQASKR